MRSHPKTHPKTHPAGIGEYDVFLKDLTNTSNVDMDDSMDEYIGEYIKHYVHEALARTRSFNVDISEYITRSSDADMDDII